MVNQDPQPEIYQTVHTFNYTGGDIAANTQRSVDVFTYQANNEEFRLYAIKVDISGTVNVSNSLILGVGGLDGSIVAPGGVALTNGVYTILSSQTNANTGVGTGAIFSMTVAGGVVTVVTATTGGSDYATGDTLTFPGTLFGGATPGGDVAITLAGGTVITSAGSVNQESLCCCTDLPASLSAATTIANASYSPDNLNASSFGGMDFNIGIRAGGQLVPSTTFDASTIFCKDSKTMALTTPVIILFKQPFQIEVSNATTLATLATYGNRTITVTLIGELGIQKQY